MLFLIAARDRVKIPGYTFTHQHRTANRRGGVGFYIRNAKVRAELSSFTDNIFESISIEAKVHKKAYPLSSVYRSPNPPALMNANAQITAIQTSLESHLSNLNAKKLNKYIFLNSNLNLLHTIIDPNISIYHNSILSNGYLQTITKATRIHNNHFSLINHILTALAQNHKQASLLATSAITFSHSYCLNTKNSTSHQPPTLLGNSVQPT
jgi:hypothetical protein